ncbi:MAG: PLD nuclease N-terminal domain-containing protein [Propionibacteriaceae bacterium]|jgi:ABC-type amino acid transport system permease subunit|nr:PLD nuclease N-terminal domain-containing protein [Propionibacteriaceae bacterium]
MRVLLVLALLAILVYTVVHVIQSDSNGVRGLPKTLWLIIVLLVPGIGLLAWWIFGRPVDTPTPQPPVFRRPPPPDAPDDDADFLRSL